MARKKNEHKVGYGKPPVHSQFKPGQSGNPKGRPAGSKNRFLTKGTENALVQRVDKFLSAEITIKENGKTRKVSHIEASLKATLANALKGRVGSQKLMYEMAQMTAEKQERSKKELLESALNYKYRFTKDFEEWDRYRAEGHDTERPHDGPDPRLIHINEETGEVIVLQEGMEERIAEDTQLIAELRENERDVARLNHLIKQAQNEKEKMSLVRQRDSAQSMVNILMPVYAQFSIYKDS